MLAGRPHLEMNQGCMNVPLAGTVVVFIVAGVIVFGVMDVKKGFS